jgi:diaminohydroxyphosphoribosylaminopyrimidine deaminase / 5-amino-6-(5-phosphoribosylamino)uracil reductase
VVVAMADPNPMSKVAAMTCCAPQGIEVVCGVCEAEARRLNESFIKFKREGGPSWF